VCDTHLIHNSFYNSRARYREHLFFERTKIQKKKCSVLQNGGNGIRPKMEKSQSKRHELSFGGLVSIVIVLIVPPKMELLVLLVETS